MRERRRELIAQPLDRIYEELTIAALEAAERERAANIAATPKGEPS